jgi:hypothetical protein
MVNLQNTPSAGPLTAADLTAARSHSAGNVYPHLHRVTMTDPTQALEELRRGVAPDTMPVEYGTGYGDDMKPIKKPRVVPCSTLARWALAAKDGNPRTAVAIVVLVAALALIAAGSMVSAWMAGS